MEKRDLIHGRLHFIFVIRNTPALFATRVFGVTRGISVLSPREGVVVFIDRRHIVPAAAHLPWAHSVLRLANERAG